MVKMKKAKLAVIALSLLQAFQSKAELLSENQRVKYFTELATFGYLRPSQTGSSYEVDLEKLQQLRRQENDGDPDAHRTLNMLQSLLGDETDIRTVDIFSVNLGTQDVIK